MPALLALHLLLAGPPTLHDWFPHPPVPTELLLVPFEGDPRRGLLLESLAGLAAADALAHGPGAMIWEDTDHSDYRRLRDAFCQRHQPKLTRTTLEGALKLLAASGAVKGYLLARFEASDRPLHSLGPHDESVNVATSLAGPLGGVVVTEETEGLAQAAGLARLLDCRGITEAEALARYGERFSRLGVGTSDPKARNARSLMVAHSLFVSSGTGPGYEGSLARCQPDAPVIGWGIAPEDRQTLPSSRAGLFQTATNWCHNLTVLSSERPGRDVPWESLQAANRVPISDHPERGKHYVCLTLTDGDNIQWLMGNFVGGSEGGSYYGNPHRGAIPFTWGLPAEGLLELSPRTLAGVLSSATANDDFVIYNGGGYFYPDCYGADRAEDCLTLQARRLRPVMERTGIRILAFNFQKWDGPAAQRACAIFARELPGLLGILAFQYYPYSAGNGAIAWVDGADGDRVPIVSCRYTVWANTGRPHDAPPGAIAARLNALPTVGERATADNFSWVLVHAWSRFRGAEPQDAIDQNDSRAGERGYEPARWLVQKLDPRVEAVSAERLLRLVRSGLGGPAATATN
jgi:hypothetical protein